jgi:preprotein translocase subunit YajC
MASWLPLFADDPTPQGAPSFAMWIPIVVLGLMFMMFLRTSSKQKRELQKALAGLKKNDKVVTAAGILGVVVAVKENEDEVTLKVDDASNTRLRVLKSSIVRITSGDTTVGEVKS